MLSAYGWSRVYNASVDDIVDSEKHYTEDGELFAIAYFDDEGLEVKKIKDYNSDGLWDYIIYLEGNTAIELRDENYDGVFEIRKERTPFNSYEPTIVIYRGVDENGNYETKHTQTVFQGRPSPN